MIVIIEILQIHGKLKLWVNLNKNSQNILSSKKLHLYVVWLSSGFSFLHTVYAGPDTIQEMFLRPMIDVFKTRRRQRESCAHRPPSWIVLLFRLVPLCELTIFWMSLRCIRTEVSTSFSPGPSQPCSPLSVKRKNDDGDLFSKVSLKS